MKDNQYKICNNCGEQNEIQEAFCSECFGTDFSNANITNEDNIEQVESNENNYISEEDNSKTIIEVKTKTLKLYNSVINQVIHNNDVVGRRAVCSSILQEYTKVSREHARFYIEDNIWSVEDLDSTNGTYLNDKKIVSNQRVEISNNDTLKLSTTFSVTIIIN